MGGVALQSAVSAPHANNVSPAVQSEDRRPLAICVRNLPIRSSGKALILYVHCEQYEHILFVKKEWRSTCKKLKASDMLVKSTPHLVHACRDLWCAL